MLTPCGARSRICCLSYRVTRNVHRCSIGLQVTSAAIFTAAARRTLSLIIMRLTLRGVTPEIISVDAAAT
jgi:hypothetical protein